MSEITKNHIMLLKAMIIATQQGELGIPDTEDLELIGRLHSIIENTPTKRRN